MRTLTFKHGVHPPGNKELSCNEPIRVLMPKAGQEMVFPLSQHIGAPCEPVVAKGDYVKIGQLIAESKAFVSSPIHSSVSGTVKDIRPWLVPTGGTVNSIVIENDGKNEEIEAMNSRSNYMSLSKEEILDIIKNAGVVGLGGAGFPTHIKLNPPPDKKIDHIIVNAAECEPYLTTDHRVMLEEGDRLVRGLEIILKLHPGAKGIIGVETNKPDAIESLTKLINGKENIEVVGLVPKYPQGSEKHLIYACTQREVPSGKLPADVGCIVDNVDTVVAIERAVVRGRPLMRRVIALTGRAVNNPGNYKVRIGMLYKDLIEAAGGFKTEPYKMVSGGPMMGFSLFTLDIPIIKTSSALLCLTEDEAPTPEERNCIRCGRCVEHCPMSLMPNELNQYILNDKLDLFEQGSGADCIECGSCSYVCPAKRHLAQTIKYGRRSVMAARAAKK